jgi:Ca2+-binding RTX toxin-like protein
VTLGTGQDTVTVGNGNDLIVTHGGNDTLTLGTGRYEILNIGSLDHDSVMLTAGAYNDLWFQKRGSDLVISGLDSHEQVTVDNWYRGEQLNSLTTSDGHTISATGINQLVQAMSAFTPPSASQTSYTAKEQKALAPVLAANWH